MIVSPIRSLCFISLLVSNGLILKAYVVATHEDNPICEDPPNLLDILADALRTFYADPETETQTLDFMRYQSHDTPATSQESLGFETSLGINDTTCPWRMRMTYDEDRIPASIAEAVCECEHCARRVRRHNGNTGCPRNGFVSGRCRPVHGPMVVFRRLCEANGGGSNVYRYVPELRNVAIGCTCERPRLS